LAALSAFAAFSYLKGSPQAVEGFTHVGYPQQLRVILGIAKLLGAIALISPGLPLRIGVNALYLIPGGVGGTEIYLRNLLAALAEIDTENRYFVFINEETARGRPPLVPRAPNFEAAATGVKATNRPLRLLWEQVALPLAAARRRLDVLFSPGFTSPLVTLGCPKVTVIHDLQHVHQRQNFGSTELAAWHATVWISVHFSRRLITVSENSRRDVVEVYRVPPDRVQVVQHGVEPDFFHLCADETLGRPIEPPYLLSVSTVHAHKNWARWLEAYGQLVRGGLPHHLVIAGLEGKYSPQLLHAVEALSLRERVHWTGWIARRELMAYFKFAEALVFPSTFEGFGMPVLEAMAAGVPVACSDIAPLREVAGPAAIYFDPSSPDSMTGAVHQLLGDAELRRRLIELGRENASHFTWPRAAEQTLAILRDAAERKVAAPQLAR
jgi:glycosyltransferase involved in cell wall biosynthesis